MNGEPVIKLSREISLGHIVQALAMVFTVGVPIMAFLVSDHSSIVGLDARLANVERGQAETHAQFQRILDARERDASEIRTKIEKVQELIMDGLKTGRK
jgi:hypothetical protein